MIFVVGDIHGEVQKLKDLLEYVPSRAQLVFIGDYIDKGPDPKAVVDFVVELRKKRKVICLVGNHEYKLLRAWQGDRKAKEFLVNYGFKTTLESYLGRRISPERCAVIMRNGFFKEVLRGHYGFFKSLRPSFETKNHFIVHSGVPVDRAGKFRSGNLEKMVFTRWDFLNTQKKFRGKVVVFGHTAFPNVFWDGVKLGIDTGAAYPKSRGYGILTALDLEKFECINHHGRKFKPDFLNEKQKRAVLRKLRGSLHDQRD